MAVLFLPRQVQATLSEAPYHRVNWVASVCGGRRRRDRRLVHAHTHKWQVLVQSVRHLLELRYTRVVHEALRANGVF